MQSYNLTATSKRCTSVNAYGPIDFNPITRTLGQIWESVALYLKYTCLRLLLCCNFTFQSCTNSNYPLYNKIWISESKVQMRAAMSGTQTWSSFYGLRVDHSIYNYWCRKMKGESEALPIAPISIFNESQEISRTGTRISGPSVMVVFPNGMRFT